MRVGVVVLTMGDRLPELRALLRSVADQEGDPVAVVVVSQGMPLHALPDGVTALELPENLGIPGGRNAGVRRLRECGGGDVVVGLDDDGLLPRTDTLRLVREAFAENPRPGIVGFRIVDEDGISRRGHVPRLGGAGPETSGPVTTFLGGGHAIRVAVIDEVGGFPAAFFYAHEETDFAWRALDAGWEIHYRADLVLRHPRTEASRHAAFYRNGVSPPRVPLYPAGASSACPNNSAYPEGSCRSMRVIRSAPAHAATAEKTEPVSQRVVAREAPVRAARSLTKAQPVRGWVSGIWAVRMRAASRGSRAARSTRSSPVSWRPSPARTRRTASSAFSRVG